MEILGIKESRDQSLVQQPVDKPAKKSEQAKKEVDAATAEYLKEVAKGNEEAIKGLAEDINRFMKESDFSLQFIPNKESGTIVIKVLDYQGNVIREIPPEAMTALSSKFGEDIGLLLNVKL
jgi:flagellar protein FlaG